MDNCKVKRICVHCGKEFYTLHGDYCSWTCWRDDKTLSSWNNLIGRDNVFEKRGILYIVDDGSVKLDLSNKRVSWCKVNVVIESATRKYFTNVNVYKYGRVPSSFVGKFNSAIIS